MFLYLFLLVDNYNIIIKHKLCLDNYNNFNSDKSIKRYYFDIHIYIYIYKYFYF